MLEPTALTFEKSGPRPHSTLSHPCPVHPASFLLKITPHFARYGRSAGAFFRSGRPPLPRPRSPVRIVGAGACVPIAKAGESLLVPRLRRLDLLFGDDRASFPSFPSTIVISINIVLCLSHDNGTQDSVIPS